MIDPDHLDADRFSAPGGQPALIVQASSWRRPALEIQAVVIGIDPDGQLPAIETDDFDILLTAAAGAPRPWVSLQNFSAHVARLADAVGINPFASTVAAQVLRLTENLSLVDAIQVESLGYSTLLCGSEFARWRTETVSEEPLAIPRDPVAIDREGDRVRLTLNDPGNRNAMSAGMRDALFEALANMLDDPTGPAVILDGAGKCFSTGGLLNEFGTVTDPAEAHAIRTLRSCARLLDALGDRATVRLHGACIGSGVEIAAAARRRIATSDVWFHLPEVTMGLIPGAGGTATISRAIGRHRTLWMLLSAKRIGATQALDWGLVHAIEDAR